MDKSIKTIGIIATATILLMLLMGYFLEVAIIQPKTITETKEVEKVVEVVPDGYINTATKDFQNNYIDLHTVTSYAGSSNGLQLYTTNGNGYYLDIEEEQEEQADTTQVYYVESENDLDTLLDALETRNGKIIIEVTTGTVDDAEGNGTDTNGYYVKYDNTRFSEGDKVQSVFVYNPNNNSTDDILFRVDTLIE